MKRRTRNVVVSWFLACSLLMPVYVSAGHAEPMAASTAETTFGQSVREPVHTELLHVNALVNGGFEVRPASGTTGIPGWIQSEEGLGEGHTTSFSSAAGTFIEGKRSLNLQASGSTIPLELYSKPVKVTPGQLVKAEGHFLLQSGEFAYSIYAYPSEDHPLDEPVKVSSESVNVTDGQWAQPQLSMTVPEDAAYIRAVIISMPDVPSQAFADHLSVDVGHQLHLQDFGPAIESVVSNRALFTEENGTNIMYVNINGASAQIAKVNLDSQTLIDQVSLSTDTIIRGMALGSDGNVYVVGYQSGKLYRYGSQTGELEEISAVAPNHNTFDLVATEDGKLYAGTYARLDGQFAKAFEYDIASGVMRDLGEVMPGMKYVHSMAYEELSGMVYFGMAADANIVKYDTINGEWASAPIPLLYDENGAEVNFSNEYKYVFDLDAMDGLVYARLSQLKNTGSRASLTNLVIDPEQNDKIIGTFTFNQSREPSPPRDGKVYFPHYTNVNGANNRYLSYYEIATNSVRLVNEEDPILFLGGINEIDIVDLNHEDYPGDTLIGMNVEGALFFYNFETGQTENIPLPVQADAGQVHAIGARNDGVIHVAGYTNTGHSIFNPVTREMTQLTGRTLGVDNYLSQAEMFIPYKEDQVFIPLYPGVIMNLYDPKQDWNRNDPSKPLNPVKMYDMNQAGPDKQERVYGGEVIERFGRETLATVTVPARDNRTGKLTFYDISRGTLEYYSPILNHSLVSFAYKEGIIYGGSSVWNSYGDTEPNEPEAKMFVWDVAANQKIKEFVPVPGKKVISKLVLGPDGNIWGLAEGHLFIYDPVQDKVIYNEPKFDIAYSSITFRDAELEIGADGNVYGTIAGRLFMIDPDTKNVYPIATDKRRLAQDNQGNLFMVDGNYHLIQVSLTGQSSADLINIKVDGQFIDGFAPEVTEYTVQLGEEASGELPLLEPVAKSEGASIAVIPPDQLPGAARVNVVSPDGSKQRTYTINLLPGDQPEERTLEQLIRDYMDSGEINAVFGDQLLYRLTIIDLLVEQGQMTTATAYLEDFLAYINDPSVLQQQLLTEAARAELEESAEELLQSWSE